MKSNNKKKSQKTKKQTSLELRYKMLTEDYINTLFIDGNRIDKHNNIFGVFEETEKNYFLSCQEAFWYAINKDKLTCDEIINIHKIAVLGVLGTNYMDKEGTVKKEDDVLRGKAYEVSFSIRNLYTMYPLLINSNCSYDGLVELKKRMAEMLGGKNVKKCIVKYLNIDYKLEFNYEEDKGILFNEIMNIIAKQDKGGYGSITFDKNIEEVVNINEVEVEQLIGYWYVNFQKEKNSLEQNKDLIQAIIEDTLSYYYSEINKCENDKLMKLKVIFNTVMRLECLHPFTDGNCRVFGMILFNKFLLENDCAPVIQIDPNRIDGYSLSEMIEFHNTDFYISNKFEKIINPENMDNVSFINQLEGELSKDCINDVESHCKIMISQCEVFNNTK
jgi:hypothetical protein